MQQESDNTDIDIDVANRLEVLEHIDYINALSTDMKTPHVVGVYVQDIPYDPRTNAAIYNYKEAEDLGFFKLDILNNSIYKDIRDDDHLTELLEREPLWDLLQEESFVNQLAQIHSHYSIVSRHKPKSIEQLAMVIAMIRPAKAHLIGAPWDVVEQEIWVKPTNGEYYFKKAHGYAYAASIVVQMNLLEDKLYAQTNL